MPPPQHPRICQPYECIGVHWELLLKWYQVFYDLCTVTAGLFVYREEFTISQIHTRICEKWGARDTLLHTLPKNNQMLKELKATEATETKGM